MSQFFTNNPMIILAIDIGNTRTAIGLFRGKKLTGIIHIPGNEISKQESLQKKLVQFLRGKGISPENLSGAVISSVVPASSKIFSNVIKRHLHLTPLIVSGALDVGLRIQYRNPKSLGADRICGAVAAYAKYGGPVIVIDAGTATTFDVVSKNGVFLGGAIAPGIMTSASALHRRTAQLPTIQLRFPKSVIGKNTTENIQSGILYGAVDGLEGMVQRIKVVTGKRTKVILTGGFSQLLKSTTGIVDAVEPALVLHGARLIFERVRNSSV
jgi:type III pantothenate kinase